jgi:acyl-CoA thioester hydrolase
MHDNKRPAVLKGYPIVIELPIQWGDLDAYGHVNNLVYLRWFEAARAEYALRVGVDIVPRSGGVGAVVASISCKYLRQLGYPGRVFSAVQIVRMSLGSVTLASLIVDGKIGVPVAEATCDVVLFDSETERPIPIPDPIRHAVEELEGKAFDV